MSKISMQNQKEEITVDKAFAKFINFKKISNLNSESLKYYERCKNYFCNFYSEKQPVNNINLETYYDYINYLQNKEPKIKDVTINSYLRGLRTMLYYFMEMEYLKPFKIKLIKADKQMKETYTDAELKQLLSKPDTKKCSFAEYRSWAMTNFFLGTGVRISSAINVKISDLDFNSYEVTIRKSKNRKPQIIPMSLSLCQALKEYLEYRNGENEEYLFCNQFGQELSKRSAQQSIERYNQQCGVDKTSAHLYRHTFAKLWILNGGDMFTLQKILGHSSLDIVKEYINIFSQELHIQYEQFNPLDSTLEKQGVKKKSLGRKK